MGAILVAYLEDRGLAKWDRLVFFGSAGPLRFAVTRSYYDSQVALLPADNRPRIAFFNWGGMIWACGSGIRRRR